MIYWLCLLLILVGLYGVVVNRNTLKIVLSLLIMEHGVHLLFILIGYRARGRAPSWWRGSDWSWPDSTPRGASWRSPGCSTAPGAPSRAG